MRMELRKAVAGFAVGAAIFNGAGLKKIEPHSSAPSVASREAGATGQAQEVSANETTDGPWLATQQYFHHSPKSKGMAEYARTLEAVGMDTAATVRPQDFRHWFGFKSNRELPRIRSFIAIVPDPLHTRLALDTDRTLASIQQAAFDSGWELATQWLPWISGDYGLDVDTVQRRTLRRQQSARETFPGLIVFRHRFDEFFPPDELLMVWVVAESPTAGIDGRQFNIARSCTLAFNGNEPVWILGPNYTGSFPSLAALIEEDRHTGQIYEIRSGSVSGFKSERHLEAGVIRLKKDIHVHFYGFRQPGKELEEQFQALIQRLGFCQGDAAVLIEDESGFAHTFSHESPEIKSKRDGLRWSCADATEIKYYTYPRDIARLRNVYRQAVNAANGKAETTQTPAVEFSLRDPQHGEDSFPVFSSVQTPIMQNALLDEIVDSLHRERIRVVSLNATNVLDALFLAGVLRRRCPEIRIVLQGADQLFAEQAAEQPLSGILALSTYPLPPFSAMWQHPSDESRLAFSDSDSLGEFYACAQLLRDECASSVSSAHREQYQFEWLYNPNTAPVWLMALNRTGWWPVDLLSPLSKAQWFKPDESQRLTLSKPVLSRPWMSLSLLLSIFALGFCSWVIYLRLRPTEFRLSSLALDNIGWKKAKNTAGQELWEQRRGMLEHARGLWLLVCLSSLTFVVGTCLIPVLAQSPGAQLPAEAIFESVVLAICVASQSVLFVVLVVNRPRSLGRLVCPTRTTRAIGWVPRLKMAFDVCSPVVWTFAIFLVPFLLLWWWWNSCNAGDNDHVQGMFVCFRTLQFSAGFSPALPLILSGTAIFTISLFHLQRFTWAGTQRPRLSTQLLDLAVAGQFGRLRHLLNRIFLSPLNMSGLTITAIIAAIVAGIFILLQLFPLWAIDSIEPNQWDWMVYVLVATLSMLNGLTLLQYFLCWSTLRKFLDTLNSLAIGRHFVRLPEFDGSGPVWIRQTRLLSLANPVNSAIALHNLGRSDPIREDWSKSYWALAKEFIATTALYCRDGDKLTLYSENCGGRIIAMPKTREQIAEAYRKFRFDAAQFAYLLSKEVIQPYWMKHRIPFLVKDLDVDNLPAAHDKENPRYEFATRYIVLQFASYIAYALRQLQNLLFCFVIGFVLLAFTLISYAFQDPQAIARLLTVSLIIAGILVIRSLAQMEKNAILSRLAGTTEGSLGKGFYFQVISVLALPAVGILTAQFPSVSSFLFSWIQPGLSAMH